MKLPKNFFLITDEINPSKEHVLKFNELIELFKSLNYYIVKKGLNDENKYLWEFKLKNNS